MVRSQKKGRSDFRSDNENFPLFRSDFPIRSPDISSRSQCSFCILIVLWWQSDAPGGGREKVITINSGGGMMLHHTFSSWQQQQPTASINTAAVPPLSNRCPSTLPSLHTIDPSMLSHSPITAHHRTFNAPPVQSLHTIDPSMPHQSHHCTPLTLPCPTSPTTSYH